MARLAEKYESEIRLKLKEKFSLGNIFEVPRLDKIVVNIGVGEAVSDSKVINKAIEDLSLITGQKPVVTKAKKSIAGFKTREGMALGVTVTLRNEMMYSFLERFINLVLPRIRDFRGLNVDGFDKKGNYNIGLREQLVFPEIDYNQIDQSRGFNISFVTTAKTADESLALLKEFGLPFKE